MINEPQPSFLDSSKYFAIVLPHHLGVCWIVTWLFLRGVRQVFHTARGGQCEAKDHAEKANARGIHILCYADLVSGSALVLHREFVRNRGTSHQTIIASNSQSATDVADPLLPIVVPD